MAAPRRRAFAEFFLPVLAALVLFSIDKAEAEEAGMDVAVAAVTDTMNLYRPCDHIYDCGDEQCLRISDYHYLEEHELCKEDSADASCYCVDLPEVAETSVGADWCDHYAHCTSGKCLRLEDQHILREDELCLEESQYHTCICVDAEPSVTEQCHTAPYHCTDDVACLHLSACEGAVGGSCTNDYPQGLGVSSTDCHEIAHGEQCTVSCFGEFKGPDVKYTCTDSVLVPDGGKPIECSKEVCLGNDLPKTPHNTTGCPGIEVGDVCTVTCNLGYKPQSFLFSCEEGGNFTGEEEECIPMVCDIGLPDGIGVNGSTCIGTVAGSTCKVECMNGFQGSPQTFSCNNDGIFTGTMPICEPKPCDVTAILGEVIGVRHTCIDLDGTPVAYGEECAAFCSMGFTGADLEILQCLSPPTLNGTVPKCVGEQCDINLPMGYGLNNTACSETTTNENCTLTCDDAFEPKLKNADDNVTCLYDNSFTDSNFECMPKACGDLKKLPGFSTTGVNTGMCDDLHSFESCTAFCDPGYDAKLGTLWFQILVCEASYRATSTDGWWNWDVLTNQVGNLASSALDCEPIECKYGKPSGIGVDASDCDGKKTGQTCTIKSAKGFAAKAAGTEDSGTAVQNTTFTCQANGVFVGEMLKVEPAKCVDPPSDLDPNGASTCADKAYGEMCWTYCGDGFEGAYGLYACLVPENKDTVEWIFIRSTGEEQVAPKCTKETQQSRVQTERTERIQLANAPCNLNDQCSSKSSGPYAGSVTAAGTQCGVECAKGYNMSSDTAIAFWECSGSSFQPAASNKMTGGLPTCIPLTCSAGEPSSPGVGHNCTGTKTDEKCLASCTDGYIGNSTTYKCEASGQLTGETPQCNPAKCTWATSPSEAYDTKNCENVTTGGRCAVTCAQGWDLNGSASTFECPTGQFTGDWPTCIPKSCRTNGVPTDSDLVASGCVNLTTGQECNVTCAEGYEGDLSTYKCATTSRVTGTRPTCKPKVCLNTVPTGGDFPTYSSTCSSVSFDKTCWVECGNGYALAENSKRQEWKCELDGDKGDVHLKGTLPVCNPVPCEYGMEFGSQVVTDCTGVGTGKNCSAACKPGYTGSHKVLTCNATKLLEGDKPECTPKACPAREIDKVEDTCATTVFDQTCFAKCETGYSIVGSNPTWRCRESYSGNNILAVAISGLWTVELEGSVPTCNPDPCLYNMPIANDIDGVDCYGKKTEETCDVKCADGYEGSSTQYKCLATSAFQGTLPDCDLITTTTTTTTLGADEIIRGSFQVEVSEDKIEDFLTNPQIKYALELAISAVTGVSDDHIEVTLTRVTTSARRLQDGTLTNKVDVSYVITLTGAHKASTGKTVADIQESLGSTSQSQMVENFKEKYKDLSGDDLDVKLVDPYAATTTTTTTLIKDGDDDDDDDGPFLVINIFAILLGIASSAACTVGVLKVLDSKKQKQRGDEGEDEPANNEETGQQQQQQGEQQHQQEQQQEEEQQQQQEKPNAEAAERAAEGAGSAAEGAELSAEGAQKVAEEAEVPEGAEKPTKKSKKKSKKSTVKELLAEQPEEAQPEAQKEAQPEAQAEAQPEAQAEAKVEGQAEAQAEAQGEQPKADDAAEATLEEIQLTEAAAAGEADPAKKKKKKKSIATVGEGGGEGEVAEGEEAKKKKKKVPKKKAAPKPDVEG